MSFVRANSVTHHVQVLGQGPRVFFLHGLGIGNLASWYFTAAAALSGQHQVVMYDLRGHGKSERIASGYDLATLAADLGSLVDHLGQEPVSLVGHSGGGLIAMRYAIAHPERVRRLVLLDVPLSPARILHLDRPELHDPARLLASLPAHLRESARPGQRRLNNLLGTLEFLFSHSSLVDDLSAEPDVSDEMLWRLGCPLLCIFGDRSYYHSHWKQPARALPLVRTEVLPGGHHIHLEQPEAVSRLITEFLDG